MKRIVAVLFGIAALCGTAAAQTPLFSDESELQIIIEGPIGELVRRASNNTDAHPATLTIDGQAFPIALSARGFSRRQASICNFPPLRLDFDASEVGETIWRGQNRLKLVTRCRSSNNYQQLTVLEYTAYRLYNVITPRSFRVRPARVTYRDSEGRRREDEQFNFLVEDVDDLARRNDLRAIDVAADEVRSSQLDPSMSATVGLFQYMIGNLDWDMVSARAGEECCHNGKLMAATRETREMVVPVPYDFDFSGFVNAPYAIPPAGLSVANVRTRYYRGLCRHNDALPAVAETFRQRRAELFAVIDNESRLSDGNRRSARRYLEDFFEILDNPDRFNRMLIERCRR